MIAQKKEFFGGLVLLIGFLVVLLLLFSNVFKGQNALEYLDSLYNSISKGSAYYIPDTREKSEKFRDRVVKVTLDLGNPRQAFEMIPIFKSAGAEAVPEGDGLRVEGDLGRILENCLADSDAMYHNQGDRVKGKYGLDEKRVLYYWWDALRVMDKALKKQKNFKEAEIVTLVKKKAVETSYNYYGVDPQKVSDRLMTMVLSLVFYVVYTLWYGFAIMFMFEGWGLRLGH